MASRPGSFHVYFGNKQANCASLFFYQSILQACLHYTQPKKEKQTKILIIICRVSLLKLLSKKLRYYHKMVLEME